MTDNTERELFEAWQINRGKKWSTVVERSGASYKFMTTENDWVIWQATRAPLLARIAELEAQLATARDDALEEAAAIASACAQEYRRDRDHGEAYAANCIARNIRALKSSAREAT